MTLALDIEPQGLKDKVGEKLGFVSKQVEGDLKRFKEFIESRGVETGAWRGRVETPRHNRVTHSQYGTAEGGCGKYSSNQTLPAPLVPEKDDEADSKECSEGRTMISTGRSTRSRSRSALVVIVIALGTLFAACGDNDVDTEATQDTVENATRDAREEAENAFGTLRTEAERLVDQFQTRNAPEAKQRLLDQCRDVLERLRRADSDQVGRVESLCDRIRDTDPSNASLWREVRDEIAKLRES